MPEKLISVCTCDDFCDSPCPAHGRENALQDKVIELRSILKDVLLSIDALLDERPILAAKVCGTTTLGNIQAEIKSILNKE